jgi:O-antigen/teichoic acid export membrane protein
MIRACSKMLNFLGQPDGHQNLSKRILHGVSWSLLNTVLTRGLTFSVALLQSHMLGKQGYGELGVVLSTLILFGLLSTGYGATCSKFIAELRNANPIRAGRIFALSSMLILLASSISSILLYSCSELVAQKFLNAPHLSPILRLASIVLVVQAAIGICDGVLSGLQSFKMKNLAALVQVATWLPLTAYMTKYWHLEGAMIAYTISYLGGFLIYLVLLIQECIKHNIKPVFSGSTLELPVIFHYTFPVALNSILVIPTIWLCNTLLVQQPGGYEALGGFNAASQWKVLILQIPMLIQGISSPIMSEFYGKRQLVQLENILISTYRLCFSNVLLCSILMILFSKKLMSIFGLEFVDDIFVMNIIVISASITALSNISGMTLLIADQAWIGAAINFSAAVITICAALILIPRYGSIGLSFSFLFACVWQNILIIRCLKSSISHKCLQLMTKLAFIVCLMPIASVCAIQLSGGYFYLASGFLLVLASLYVLKLDLLSDWQLIKQDFR